MAAKPPWLTVHPLSPEDSLGATALRASVAAFKGKLAGTAARGPFDAVMERVAAPAGVTFVADTGAAAEGCGDHSRAWRLVQLGNRQRVPQFRRPHRFQRWS